MSTLRSPSENITYDFVLASAAMSNISCSSWMVFERGGKWLYSCCFVGSCFQDWFSIAHSILVSNLFSIHFVSVHVVNPYSNVDTTTAWQKFRFNLSNRPDFHIIDSLSIAVHAFARHVLKSLSVDEMLLLIFGLAWFGCTSPIVNY